MSIEAIIIEVILIAFAGFIDAIGGGGGFITIPTFLLVGVPANLVLGTNKLTATIGGSSALYQFLRHNRINLSLMKYGVLTGLFGAVFGALLSHLLDAQAIIYLLLVLIPFIFVINTFKTKFTQMQQVKSLSESQTLIRTMLVSFIVGSYDGFFGPGTGTFLLLGFVFFLSMDYCDASINARLINFTSNFAALCYFIVVGRIDWLPALIGIPASAFGYFLGSKILIKGHSRIVKIVVNLVLIVLMIQLIFKYLI